MPAAAGEGRKPSTKSKVKDLFNFPRNEARRSSVLNQSQRLHGRPDLGCTGLGSEDGSARAFAVKAEKAHGVCDGDRYTTSNPGRKERSICCFCLGLACHALRRGRLHGMESNLRVSGGSGYSGQPLSELDLVLVSHRIVSS